MLVERKNTLENGNLKVTIVGDSFTEFYEDTYLEKICNNLNLKVIDHVGFRGGSQYRIYKKFLSQLEKSPDIMICVHTESSRLYKDNYCINSSTAKYFNTNPSADRITNKPPEVYKAADSYYRHIYNEECSKFFHNLTISDMQKLCNIKNIKMVNIPAFYNSYINKHYGLWLSIQPDGLLTISNKCMNLEKKSFIFEDYKNLKNHITPEYHDFIADKFSHHIFSYILDNVSKNIIFNEGSSKGRTRDFDSWYWGSNPCPSTNI